MSMRSNKLTLLTIAGVYTAPAFLDEFREALAARLSVAGRVITARAAFPYGDWSRSRIAQSAEIAADVCFGGIGAGRIVRLLDGERDPGPIAMIGHSGGGVAAVHAAAKLIERGWDVASIVMIGSPRTPIPASVSDRTLRITAVDDAGGVKDRVARLGHWRGRAPARSVGLRIVGGHPDYFRSRSPFLDETGRSNLEATTEIVARWVEDCMGRRI